MRLGRRKCFFSPAELERLPKSRTPQGSGPQPSRLVLALESLGRGDLGRSPASRDLPRSGEPCVTPSLPVE